MRTLVRVSSAVAAAFAPDGFNIWHSVGEVGGQEVFPAHFHIFPRRASDGLMRVYGSGPPPPTDLAELARQARLIREQLQTP